LGSWKEIGRGLIHVFSVDLEKSRSMIVLFKELEEI